MHPCALLGMGSTHGVARDAPWPKIKPLGMLAKPNVRLHFARNTGYGITASRVIARLQHELRIKSNHKPKLASNNTADFAAGTAFSLVSSLQLTGF